MHPYIQLSIDILQWFIFIYMAFGSIYIFTFAFGGLFYRTKTQAKDAIKRNYAVLIPGYKEDAVIIEVAKEALKQNFETSRYDVFIIADSFLPETIKQLQSLPIHVIEVSFEKSTKSKALNAAMSQIPDGKYDVAVVLDADNVMEKDFLTKLDQRFKAGYRVVQGHRVAKNTNNQFAVLDAISEEINNHIFRKGHRALGLSSALIGSGMAFQYDFFKNIMSNIDAIGGFDKELELKMLRDKITIDYLEDGYVYDEKVQKADVMYNQRRRWLSAQFYYFRKFFGHSLLSLFTKGNIDYFDKALQMIMPPRIILIGVLGIQFIVSFFFSSGPGSIFWQTTFATMFIALLLSVPRKFYNKQLVFAVLKLPLGFFIMFKSLLNLKGANKKFIHTPHTSTSEINPDKS